MDRNGAAAGEVAPGAGGLGGRYVSDKPAGPIGQLVVRVGYHWFVAGSCEDYPVFGAGGEYYVRAVWGQEWNGSWEVFPVHEVLDLRWIGEIAGLGAWF